MLRFCKEALFYADISTEKVIKGLQSKNDMVMFQTIKTEHGIEFSEKKHFKGIKTKARLNMFLST